MRQDADPERRGSGPRIPPVASGLAVPACVAEPVPCLAPAAARACALDGQSSCPRTSPYRLTPPEVRAIENMVTSPEYRHVPTGTLAVLAQRLGKVWASPSTWHRLVRKNGWRRPRLRVHPAKPKIGLRTTRANEMWHID